MKTTCLGTVHRESRSAPDAEPLGVTAARLAGALEDSVREFAGAGEENLGHLESQVARQAQELLRQATEAGAQKKADATPPLCPVCQRALTRLSAGHRRTFGTRFGPVALGRTRGYCKRCRQWRVPADAALGLEESAGHSLRRPGDGGAPGRQDARGRSQRRAGTVDRREAAARHAGSRKARRQGERAQKLRRQLDESAAAPQKKQLELTLEPCQMIIQMDAWNIRERDDWGRSAALRRAGKEPERRPWAYTGTCFRLDHRAQTAGGRPVIVERGFVATRGGLEALREQLHAEALRRGLGQAAGALIIADGAAWIWRLADDRFPQARQRLDFYHAVQHLAAVGRAVFGEDTTKLKAWLKPLVRQLKNESAVKVIRQLEAVLCALPMGPASEAVRKEINCLQEHQERMDCRAGRRRGEPIGSGAVEAACRQSQCRFKRPGQFWSQAGDEALLCLEMLWRNGRWHLLFPHAPPHDPARN